MREGIVELDGAIDGHCASQYDFSRTTGRGIP